MQKTYLMEKHTEGFGDIGNGADILMVMTLEEEKAAVIKELENILTIDGRGRPAKAKAPLWLFDRHGRAIVEQALKEISERKWF